MKTIIQQIAAIVAAKKRCQYNGNDYAKIHDATLRDIESNLPSGSGIDCGTKICDNDCLDEKVVLSCEFHHMNEDGYYDGWTFHEIIVTPSFSGINIRFTGINRNNIKEYLHEVYSQALTQEYKQ